MEEKDPKKKSKLKTALSFLTGDHKDKKTTEDNKKEVIGFWKYLSLRWGSIKKDQPEPKPNKTEGDPSKEPPVKKEPGFIEKTKAVLNPDIKKEEKSTLTQESTEEQSDKPIGLYGKIKNLYSHYQLVKEKEVEKLHIFESISESAKLSKEFLVLLVCSCLIATIGLYQNSSAVIIGAMIIAPLMMPILGFSLGTIWGDRSLLQRSLLILFIGSLFVFTVSALLTYLIPGVEINSEISARIHPNLYDIFIALASGMVGAYAYVHPRISSSVSGVAISVALMPPLCVVGICFGLGDTKAMLGASLLYLTNLISIALSASLVFWRLKIHPATESNENVVTRAKRKVVVATTMLLIIAVPLGYFMRETFIIKQKRVEVRRILTENIDESHIISLKVEKYTDHYSVNAMIVLSENTSKSVILKMKGDIKNEFNGKKVKISLIVLGQAVLSE